MSLVNREKLVERLMGTFLDELDEHVRILNRDALVLDHEPARPDRAEILKTLFRAAHSLKGAARSVSATSIEGDCHRLEDLLGRARDGTISLGPEQLQEIFATVDRIAGTGERMRADRVAAAPPRVAEPSAEPRPPPIAPPHEESSSFARVSSAKLDALLDRSGELMVARRRIEDRADEVIALHAAASGARRDFRQLARSLPQIARDPKGNDEARAAAKSSGNARSTELPRRGALLLRQTAARLQKLERDAERLVAAVLADGRLLRQAAIPLEEEILRVRMLPFADACEGLFRATRDLAKASGKEVDLVAGDGSVELDRSVLEKLKDPLLHLVRNAIDHGIEPPEVRRAQGKSARGRITVKAALRGGSVQVTVEDDGAGLDLEAIRERARSRDLPVPHDDRELARMIFLPGFSTSRAITEISGRGVGLDVVESRAVALHGSVALEWTRRRGTRFTLTVPLTLTVVRALLVRVRDQSFAFVGASVRTVLRAGPARLCSIEGRDALLTDGAPVPVIALVDVLGMRARDPVAADRALLLILVSAGDQEVAFIVDEVVAEQDVVVKNLGARLVRVRHVAGATVLPTGKIALVLNSAELVRTALGQGPGRPAAARALGGESPRAKRLLVVDDSVTTRALEKSILESEGYEVAAASDGEEAWQMLQSMDADLVISDVEMPRMDGFALTRAIRAVKRFRDLPVVLVTGLESEPDRARGIAAGADAYLLKSAFDQRNLLETIKQLL